MLDPKITDQIIAAWQADESHPHRGRTKRTLPPTHAIQKFIDVTFLATLRDEEGQQIRFSVALVLDKDLIEPLSPTVLTPMQLSVSQDFSDSTLVKLAAAFDPALSTIIVKWNDKKDSLSYWGITFHAPGLNRFTEVPVGIKGSANFRPDYFTVISRGRGAITIARGNSQIGTFQAGYFVASTPTPFTSRSLGQYIQDEIKSDPFFPTYGNYYFLFVRDGLEELLSESLMRGHGGTIVLLPSHMSTKMYENKYKMTGSYGLRQILQQCIKNERSIELSISIAYRKVANEIIQRIAQLSAVDGALILTYGFEVVSFGATLTAPRSSLSAFVGPDGFGQIGNTTFPIDSYGTRHRSAFDFASAHLGAVVFVISQDGPIRAFRRENDNVVYVWPDCTASMFV